MVIGKLCQRLVIGFLVVLLPVPAAAVAVSAPLPVEKSVESAPPAAVQPMSAEVADPVTGLSQPSEFVTDVHVVAPKRPMGPVVFAGMSVLEILLIGGALIALVMFARRRHRRRIGWGVIPDRSVGRMRRVG